MKLLLIYFSQQFFFFNFFFFFFFFVVLNLITVGRLKEINVEPLEDFSYNKIFNI
jgi:hypothetical protein